MVFVDYQELPNPPKVARGKQTTDVISLKQNGGLRCTLFGQYIIPVLP